MYLGHLVTKFQAQIWAIQCCAEMIDNDVDIREKEVIIFCTESLITMALSRNKILSANNKACIQVLNRLARLVKVRVISGISKGVEEMGATVDLARTGLRAGLMGPELMLGKRPTQVRTALKHWEFHETTTAWLAVPNCRQTKQLVPRPKSILTNWLLGTTNKRRLKLIVGILTGHCPLQKHLNILGKVDDPLCPMCSEEEETVPHYLGECMRYTIIRQKYFGTVTCTIEDIEKLSPAAIAGFITESGRFDYQPVN